MLDKSSVVLIETESDTLVQKRLSLPPREGGTAYIMAFKGRLRLKGIPFLGFSCMKT